LQGLLTQVLDAARGPLDDDPLADAIAAAALEQFSELGIRRSTMEDVARRAGVSRITVFRRFSTKEGLVQAVIEHEILRANETLEQAWAGADTTEERLVQSFRVLVDFVGGHPLLDRLLRSEPEAVLPILTINGLPVIEFYRSVIAKRLRVEVARGGIAPPDIDQASEVLARLAISIALTPGGLAGREDPARLEAALRSLVMPMLRPQR